MSKKYNAQFNYMSMNLPLDSHLRTSRHLLTRKENGDLKWEVVPFKAGVDLPVLNWEELNNYLHLLFKGMSADIKSSILQSASDDKDFVRSSQFDEMVSINTEKLPVMGTLVVMESDPLDEDRYKVLYHVGVLCLTENRSGGVWLNVSDELPFIQKKTK